MLNKMLLKYTYNTIELHNSVEEFYCFNKIFLLYLIHAFSHQFYLYIQVWIFIFFTLIVIK